MMALDGCGRITKESPDALRGDTRQANSLGVKYQHARHSWLSMIGNKHREGAAR
jgi:hypothetical protein